MLCPLGHDAEELLIEIGYQPTAMLEVAVAVLVRTARCLHYAIQSHESTDNQLSHVLPSVSVAGTAACRPTQQ